MIRNHTLTLTHTLTRAHTHTHTHTHTHVHTHSHVHTHTLTHTQVFKGTAASCTIPIRAHGATHEARVRGALSCEVNGREEVIWGGYCQPVECVCRKEKEEEKEEPVGDEEEVPARKTERVWLSGRQRGMLVFVLLSLLTLVLALLLGLYTT